MEGKYLYEIGDLVKVRDDIDRNMQYRMRSGPKAGREPGTVYYIENIRGQSTKSSLMMRVITKPTMTLIVCSGLMKCLSRCR